jgi:DNA-binding CsgD family transcriptional regulator
MGRVVYGKQNETEICPCDYLPWISRSFDVLGGEERTDNPTIDSLRHAFGLTYREAEMTIAIAHGQGLKAAAAKVGVAITTARSQLQQAFAKTGTNHQAELAALVRTLTHLRRN